MSTTKAMPRVWRARCGVDGSRWVAEMHDDIPPPNGSFCPDCQARRLTAPGVLHWTADRPKTNPAERATHCVYASGCLWNCVTQCGDGRAKIPLEERQRRLRERVAEEQQPRAATLVTSFVEMTYWHCEACGWSQPSVGAPETCEMCGAEDMTQEGSTDA